MSLSNALPTQRTESPLELIKELYKEQPDLFVPTPTGGAFYRTRMFNDAKRKWIDTAALGPAGKAFAQKEANKLFQEKNPIFELPYTAKKIEAISRIYDRLTKDLIGDPNGTPAQKMQATQWNDFWANVKQEKNLTDHDIRALQDDFIESYRYRVLEKVRIKGMKKSQTDEASIQWRDKMRFLVPLNGRYRETAPTPEGDTFQSVRKDENSVLERLFDYFKVRESRADLDNILAREELNPNFLDEFEKVKMYKLFGEKGMEQEDVDALLSKKVKGTGMGPLEFAISQKDQNLAKIFISLGAEVNSSTTAYKRSFGERVRDAISGFPGKALENWRNKPERSFQQIAGNYGWDLQAMRGPENPRMPASPISLKIPQFDKDKDPEFDISEESQIKPVVWQAGKNPVKETKKQETAPVIQAESKTHNHFKKG